MPAARAPPTSVMRESPMWIDSAADAAVAFSAASQIRGSGLRIPTAEESMTMSTGTPEPGPTWQIASSRSRASTDPSALETIPIRTPVAASAGSPSIDSRRRPAQAPGVVSAA